MRWIALACLALAACGGCGEKSPAASGPGAELGGPVDPPAELVAEAVVPSPGASWQELRQALGSEAVFLPSSVGGLCASLFGLPIRAAQEIDERLPVFAALGDGPQLAVAVHVKDGPGLVHLLVSGPDGQFTSTRDGNHLTWLEPKPEARPPGLAVKLAVLGNYLIAGSDKDAALALAPYLVRTLAPKNPGDPSGKRGASDVTMHLGERAFAKPLAAALASVNVEPLAPLVDLAAIKDELAAALSALSGADVAVSLSRTTLVVDVAARARAPSPWGDLATVDPRRLAELPDDTIAAMSWSETAAGRAARAGARAKAIADKLAIDGSDRAALAQGLADVAGGRGDRTTAGVRCTGAGLTGFAFGEVSDDKRLAGALADLVPLRSSPGVAAALKSAGLRTTVQRGRLEVLPLDVTLLRLEREQPEGAAPIDLRWAIGERFFAAAGVDTVETLQELYRPEEARTLAAKPTMRAALDAVAERAWLAVLVDPQGAVACRAGSPGGFATPVTLTAGPAEGGAKIHLEAARTLLPVLARTLGR